MLCLSLRLVKTRRKGAVDQLENGNDKIVPVYI